MSDSKALLPLVQAFFQDYLAGQRGLSSNTIRVYRDALKLFLAFLASSSGKPAARLQPNDLQAERVLSKLRDASDIGVASRCINLKATR
jgi:site-specific recombinase XerD